jgi:hypothetical protein
MSLFVKKGTTAHNPRTVTDGLIFYLDPNNAKCRSANGLKFTDLIQKYSSVPDLSAGIMLARSNPLTAIDGNIFLTLTGSNLLSGVVGPDNELNALENFTVQFWVKNNKPTSNFKNIFSNTGIPLRLPTTATITVSTNYPYSPTFKNIGINGIYNVNGTLTNGKLAYTRRVPDISTTRPFIVSWLPDQSRWILRNGFEYAAHFISDTSADFPSESTWSLILTTIRINTGGIPDNFFGNSPGNLLDIFYPSFPTAYRTRPWVNSTFGNDDKDFPTIGRSSLSEPWSLNFGSYGPLYSATNIADRPWQDSIFNFNSSVTALSCSTNLVGAPFAGDLVLSGGWLGFEFEEGRLACYRDLTLPERDFFTNSAYLYYDTTGPAGEGWYIDGTFGILLSSGSTSTYPWDVDKWIPYPGLFNFTLTPYFTVVKFDPPPLTAVPLPPSDYSNVNLILSTDYYEAPDKGLFLSGSNNFLSFSYSNSDGFLPLKRTLFETNTANWYCITLAQSGKHVTLYKNSTKQTVSNLSTKYFNLSSLFFGNDVTIGQILLYNKHLSPFEIRQNYNSFRSRYRSSETIKLPPPVTYILVTGAGLRWVNGIYTERGLYNGKKYYNLINSPDIGLDMAAITWVTGLERWVIWDVYGDIIYTSSEDVEFPWETTTWIDFTNEYPPPPKLTPRFEPVPQTFRKYSYGRWFNGLTFSFTENYPSYQIKSGSSWPPDLQSLKLYCNYINVGGIQYDIEDYIFEAFEPDDLGYDDVGFGLGFISYINALNSLLESYVGGIELFPAGSNLIVADFTAITPDFEILLTDEYNFSSGSYNQFYIIKKENNEITDAISNNFEGLPLNWLG